jgi:glycosyltransferase involved in cell wall biosynthesis
MKRSKILKGALGKNFSKDFRKDPPKAINPPRKELVKQTSGAKKLKVLFIINPERGAGAELSLLEVAKCLDRSRYEVILGLLKNVPYEAAIVPQDFRKIRFSLSDLKGIFMVKFLLRLLWVLLRNDIPIMHVNSYGIGNWARLGAVMMGVPIIIDHWRGLQRINPKRKFICQFLGRFTDVSLTISRSVRDHIAQQCQLPLTLFRINYVGIDCEYYQSGRPREAVRRELGLPLDLPVVGIVARLDHWGKGHQELFPALAMVRRYYRVHALVVGGGRIQEEVQRKAEELGLADIVHFFGMRRDIPDLLAAMDIFTIPSHSEGLCRALLEAMAAGLPVIASEVGGMPEVVRHEENGLLIPARDPEALGQAMLRLLADPEWAKALGDKAKAHVREHFSKDRMAKEINEIYDELVEQKLPKR